MGTLTAPAALATDLEAWAHRVADVLVAEAITVGDEATWLAPTVASVDGVMGAVRRTGEPSLYDGSAGIAWALARAAEALDRDDLLTLAVAAARHAVSQHTRLAGPGLYDGGAGVGLAAVSVGIAAGDRDIQVHGETLLARAAAGPPSEADLISGAAGVIVALLDTARLTGESRWIDAAGALGDGLVAAAKRTAWGWSWPAGGAPGLCGLAHGASGVAFALGRLGAALGVDRFAPAVDGALCYERSRFDASRSNWPDLRPDSVEPGGPVPYPAMWCHGATGIGLARLGLSRVDPRPALVAEAGAALQAATAAATEELAGDRPGYGLTICHGLGGTVALALFAHEVLGPSEHLDAARWMLGRALEWLGPDVERWPGGVRDGGPSPSLMTGLAGTLLLLLRAAHPDPGAHECSCAVLAL